MDTERLNMQTTTTFYLDMQTTTTFYLEMQTSTTFYLDMQTTITFYLDRHCFIGIRRQRAELVGGKLKGFGPVLLLRMAWCVAVRFNGCSLHKRQEAEQEQAIY
ncbi:hypothetical protein F442_10199 [Phytophthora nicotianae P10297]|uniref:Uncharacterized protein n=1 Tax=Phytophthora nicotianae P10297 TaxID=1317064 RepID=W2Z7H6_PHYNI|nr:hypothetical protein F442_10199 [Phytophthora nicotianae P10297]